MHNPFLPILDEHTTLVLGFACYNLDGVLMMLFSKQVPVLAAAAGLLVATVGPASAFYGLVVGEAGQPSTNFFIEDNDATDQNATSGTIRFDGGGCATCPAPLTIGDYTVHNIFSTLKHLPVGVILKVEIFASTSSTIPTGLAVQASANDLDPGLRYSPGYGKINTTPSWARGNAYSSGAGNIPTSVSWDGWASASNTPFDQEQLVASLAVQSTDFSSTVGVFSASAYGRGFVDLGRGDPIAITQTIVVNTDGPSEFGVSGDTIVAPVPGALPLMASAFAAMAFLRIRRRSTA